MTQETCIITDTKLRDFTSEDLGHIRRKETPVEGNFQEKRERGN